MIQDWLPHLHAGVTLYMAGLIWFVQLVHYPLMRDVGPAHYQAYQSLHEKRTAYAVGPAMLAELACAALLCAFPPPGVPPWMAWAGLALVIGIWLSTALLQVPCHRILACGFDPIAHRRLVRSNWVRTAAWSMRGVLALLII